MARQTRTLGILAVVILAVMGVVIQAETLNLQGIVTAQAFPQSVTIRLGPQRRYEMIFRAKFNRVQLAQIDIGYGSIGRDRRAVKLGARDHAHSTLSGQTTEVRRYPGLLNQCQVTGYGDGFGRFRNARQAETCG